MQQKEYTQMRILKPLLKVPIGACFLWATFVSAQQNQQQFTINYKDASLSTIIREIERQSTYRFVYSQSTNINKPLVSLSVKNLDINKIISELQTQTGLQFQINGNSISIKKIDADPHKSTVSGTVVELENFQPLDGVLVEVAETQTQTITDTQGKYAFNLPEGNYTLEFSVKGYDHRKVSIQSTSEKNSVYDIKLQGLSSNAEINNRENSIQEVVLSGTRKSRKPVAYSSVKQVMAEIKEAPVTISAISSEQIGKSADRNAGEAVKKISGVSVRDDKFIIIRGMNERYNLTYINDNTAPSTEIYSRAFALDLIPTRIIDKILVYKTPSADLLGDMTGGAVKIYTKDAKQVKSFDIELQQGYREGTTYSNILSYKGGKTDFLGFDDGSRKLPSVVPGMKDPNKAMISQQDYVKGFSPVLTYGRKTAMPTFQLTANYYNSFKVMGKRLSTLTSFSYKYDPVQIKTAKAENMLTWNYAEPNDKGEPIKNPDGNTYIGSYGTEEQSFINAQMSLLQNFSLSLNPNTKITFKNFLLQQGQSFTSLSTMMANPSITPDGEIKYINGGGLGYFQKPEAYKRTITLGYTERFLYSGNLSGIHAFDNGKHHLDWNLGFTYNQVSMPDLRQIRMKNLSKVPSDSPIPLSPDFENNWIPQTRSQHFEDYSGGNVELGHISRTWISNAEKVYNFSGDYTFKPTHWIKFKAGTFQQFKQREVFRRTYTVNEGDLTDEGYISNDVIGSGTAMDFNKVYFKQSDLSRLWSTDFLRDDRSALRVYDRTSPSDSYIGTEQNNSGYALVSLTPLSRKIELYGGIRVENNIMKVGVGTTNIAASGQSGTLYTPILINLKSVEWLPSLNISYRPNDSWVMRFAYGKTLNRPEFKEITPYREIDYISGSYVVGNPNLVGSVSKNYDARLEFYPKANSNGETVSLGGFYKEIDQPIERTISKSLFFSNLLPTTSFMNADRAKIYGLEFDLNKDFSFFGGSFFRNLSFIANFSLIKSEAEINITGNNVYTQQYQNDNPVIKRKLQGQSPYIINAGLYYENPKSGSKLGFIYNQVGERIYAVGIGVPAFMTATEHNPGNRGSTIELPRNQLDFSYTQRLKKGLQLKLSVQNVLNSPIKTAEDSNFNYKYDRTSFTDGTIQYINGSVVTQIPIKNIKGDYASSNYKPGRFFIMNLTYNF